MASCVSRSVSSSNGGSPKSAIFIGKRMLDHGRLGCTLRLNNTPYVPGKLVFSGVAQEVMICSMRASSFGFLVETEDLKGKNY